MTSTSSDGVVARDLPAGSVSSHVQGGDLRAGSWTRLGSGATLGDAVTEAMLGGIAERSRQAARAQGYATGWAEGRRVALAKAAEEAEGVRRAAEAAEARREVEHRDALAALDAAAAQLRTRLSETVDAVAEQAVELALRLTEAILGREVATATDPGGDALRRALSLVDPHVAVTVRMHPKDRATLDLEALGDRAVTVLDDETLQPGDAVALTEDTLVDATISAALERVWEVLTR
ncbi:MAG TPA: FliH/SctL family protein [Nocardioidaceae bacterium]|nr:FliH/SctL family protein [Nocardioidaceae bacterium]